MSKTKQKLIFSSAILPALLMAAIPNTVLTRYLASIPHSVPQLKNWGLENKISDSHIHALDAWKLEKGSKDVVVAVVDTGIDATHPDIKNNLWKDKTTGGYGWDFVTNKANPKDEHGHGTHVAGILGATLNSANGISGVAPNISIMAVRYYSEKSSGADNLKNSISSLNWAIDHGAHIINYSGGGPEFSQDEFNAIKRARDKGIMVVAAAGNERQNADLPENYYYPCAYRLENIVCVTAVNIRNEVLPSSNWGKKMVDVAAPGENILSTVPGGKYSYMTGTSQATAFVTGLAALMLSHDRSLKPSDIREIIRSTSDRLPSLKEKVISGGKINAAAAIAQLDRNKKPVSKVLLAKTLIEKKPIRSSLRAISSPIAAKRANPFKAALLEKNI